MGRYGFIMTATDSTGAILSDAFESTDTTQVQVLKCTGAGPKSYATHVIAGAGATWVVQFIPPVGITGVIFLKATGKQQWSMLGFFRVMFWLYVAFIDSANLTVIDSDSSGTPQGDSVFQVTTNLSPISGIFFELFDILDKRVVFSQ